MLLCGEGFHLFLKGISLVSVGRTSKADTWFQRAARTTGRQNPTVHICFRPPVKD